MLDLPKLPRMPVPVFRSRDLLNGSKKKLKLSQKGTRSGSTDENSIVKTTTPKPEKKHLCKYFVKNACIRGRNCTFSHDLSKFPCKLFHIKKNCRRKNCQFSHAPISEEEIKMLVSDGWELEKEEKEEVFVSPFI
ncbi:hypothetical protein NEHOM01_2201 [Nematocida homosporus]|uniref:uncharacterized protein n=1 Tax=Nematocida homosporus TaxID=1912981 RepID=UPI0022201F46|nr:uncharacterized protein NEHOM01_2201 [Nematocida homosporus]KAI5187468.1 hypothetical protein NEHOM01_2201 [Nematocida homosporus]